MWYAVIGIALAVSLFFNWRQSQEKLDLQEKLWEAAEWVDPVALEEIDK